VPTADGSLYVANGHKVKAAVNHGGRPAKWSK
jgi:hypothetical protein